MSDKNVKIAQSTAAIIIFSLLGKILGFARESLQAAKFGATYEASAFVLAQGATGMISTLITTAIATTFIPVIQRAENEMGPKYKVRYTNNLIFISILITFILTILSIFLSPYIAMLTASRAKPETYQLVVKLVEVGMPVIIFSAVVGVFTGFLQYGGRFAAASAIAIPMNIVYIVYLSFFSESFGIVGLTVASVLAVVAQIFILLPDSFRLGYRPKFVLDFKDHYVKEALILAMPVLISASVNDINVIVNRNIASGLSDQAAAILNVANKMNLLILGIFITAITAIIFPMMTKAFSKGDTLQGKRVMSTSIKSVLYLTVPASIGLLILARPLIEIAFVHGKFTYENGLEATSTLRCYTLSLISMSLSNVLNRVFYSLEDTKTPFVIGAVNVAINVALNILVAHKFGVQGLAASVSIATTIAVTVSYIKLHKKIGALGGRGYLRAIIKTLLSSLAMGFVAYVYFPLEMILISKVSNTSVLLLSKLLVLMVVVCLALAVYLSCMYLLGVREIKGLAEFTIDKVESFKEKRRNK